MYKAPTMPSRGVVGRVGGGVLLFAFFAHLLRKFFLSPSSSYSFALWAWPRLGRSRKLTFVGRVTRLFVFPVKACNGVSVQDAYLSKDGIRLHETSPIRDRHWAILETSSDQIIHLKYQQNYIRISPKFLDAAGEEVVGNFQAAGDLCILLTAPNASSIQLPVLPVSGASSRDDSTTTTTITTKPQIAFQTLTTTPAIESSKELDDWINQVVGCDKESPQYRLVAKPGDFALRRPDDEPTSGGFLGKAKTSDLVAFQAIAPLQLMNEASLADLNRLILEKHGGKIESSAPGESNLSASSKGVDMINFRPNLVVDSGHAYDEDNWKEIWISSGHDGLVRGAAVPCAELTHAVKLRRTAPCLRCTITTVDPETGKYRADREPYPTLIRHRCLPGWGAAPVLGSYLGVDVDGAVRVGDAVFVEMEEGIPAPVAEKVAEYERFFGKKF